MSLTTSTLFKELTLEANGDPEGGDVTTVLSGSPMEYEKLTLVVRSMTAVNYRVQSLLGGALQGAASDVLGAPFVRVFTFDGLFPAARPPKKREPEGRNIEPDPIAAGFQITNLDAGQNRVKLWLTWQQCRGSGG